MNTRYLLTQGTIVSGGTIMEADLALSDGKVEAIGSLSPEQYTGYSVINASGKYILPGGIDPHVHLSLPTPAGRSSDDFRSGSLAALSGGTTSLIDFVTPSRGQSLLEALELRRKEAESSLCNWKLHMGISEWNERVADEVRQCVRHEGITSFKAYLAYRDTIGITEGQLEKLMRVVEQEGAMVLVHCEEGEIISAKQKQLLALGHTHAAYHAVSRPPETEINAVKNVISLSERTGCKVYLVHISTGGGAISIRKAKEKGLNVHGETCIQYLVLNDNVYDASLPNQRVMPYVISPPLRPESDRLLLWDELRQGTFDTVATDHCPFNLVGQKDLGMKDFTRIPNGAGGIEFRLSLLFSFGVQKGLLSMNQFSELSCSHAAGLFGWGENKGKVAMGYDADVVVWDPLTQWKITGESQVQRCDSNVYEGLRCIGEANQVFIQGKLVYQKNK